jgi:hypothetical protein
VIGLLLDFIISAIIGFIVGWWLSAMDDRDWRDRHYDEFD